MINPQIIEPSQLSSEKFIVQESLVFSWVEGGDVQLIFPKGREISEQREITSKKLEGLREAKN